MIILGLNHSTRIHADATDEHRYHPCAIRQTAYKERVIDRNHRRSVPFV